MILKLRHLNPNEEIVETRVCEHDRGWVIVKETVGSDDKRIIASYPKGRQPWLRYTGTYTNPSVMFDITTDDFIPLLTLLMNKVAPEGMSEELLPWREVTVDGNQLRQLILQTNNRYIYGWLPLLTEGFTLTIGGEDSWDSMLWKLFSVFDDMIREKSDLELLA